MTAAATKRTAAKRAAAPKKAAKQTVTAAKKKPAKKKPATKSPATKSPARKKQATERTLTASVKALPKHVVDYIKANPKLALSAVAGVGLAVATSLVGPLKVLKLAANPALVALVKQVAERALETAKAAA